MQSFLRVWGGNSALQRVIALALLVLVLASSLLLALLVTSAAGSVPGTTCTAAQKAQRQRAVRTYQTKMPPARKAYFKGHKQAKMRAAFVKSQRAKLARLRHAAACVVPQPAPPSPPPATTTTETGPVPAPPPSPNELFYFDSGITAADQDEIKGDIAFAAEDEQRLRRSVSRKGDRFCLHRCHMARRAAMRVLRLQRRLCREHRLPLRLRQFHSSGRSRRGLHLLGCSILAVRRGNDQKILAHELFHVLQYQTDHLINAGSTPFRSDPSERTRLARRGRS